MIKDIRKECETYARLLGDYQAIKVDELCDGYCLAIDEQDDLNMNKYLAALVLRFWYVMGKLKRTNRDLELSREDYYCWLVDSINYACKYRAWQNPEKNVNARQCINQCISTIRLQHYYDYNLDKHKANINTMDLDTPFEGGDYGNTIGDTLVYEPTGAAGNGEAKDLIQSYVDNKKIIEAIILDTIAYNDTEKRTRQTIKYVNADGEEVKQVEHYREPWAFRLVQILGALPEDYDKYFSNKYKVASNELKVALDAVNASSNQKLYKYYDKTIEDLKTVIAR